MELRSFVLKAGIGAEILQPVCSTMEVMIKIHDLYVREN